MALELLLDNEDTGHFDSGETLTAWRTMGFRALEYRYPTTTGSEAHRTGRLPFVQSVTDLEITDGTNKDLGVSNRYRKRSTWANVRTSSTGGIGAQFLSGRRNCSSLGVRETLTGPSNAA